MGSGAGNGHHTTGQGVTAETCASSRVGSAPTVNRGGCSAVSREAAFPGGASPPPEPHDADRQEPGPLMVGREAGVRGEAVDPKEPSTPGRRLALCPGQHGCADPTPGQVTPDGQAVDVGGVSLVAPAPEAAVGPKQPDDGHRLAVAPGHPNLARRDPVGDPWRDERPRPLVDAAPDEPSSSLLQDHPNGLGIGPPRRLQDDRRLMACHRDYGRSSRARKSGESARWAGSKLPRTPARVRATPGRLARRGAA